MNYRLLNTGTGYARQMAESAHPKLWQGWKVGFDPCVQPGGIHAAAAGVPVPTMPDLSPYRYAFGPLFTTSISPIQSPIGPAWDWAGNNAFEQRAAGTPGLPAKILTNSDRDKLTIQAFFKFSHAASAKQSTIIASDNATASSTTEYGYRLWVDNNADKVKLSISDTYVAAGPSGTQHTYTSASTLTAEKWYHLVVLFNLDMVADANIGQGGVMFLDGQFEFPTISGTENNGSHLSTQHSRIGSTFGNTSPDFSVAMVNVWDRALSFREIDELYVDPLAMFRPRARSGARVRTITPWYLDQHRRAS